MGVQWTSLPPSAAQMRQVVRREQNAALKDIGQFVRAKAARYPAKADSSTYRRTGTLGRSIAVGKVMRYGAAVWLEVGTNKYYARWVEDGTGIYGPRKRPIRPKIAQALAWRSTGTALFGGSRSVLIAAGIARRKGKIAANARRDIYLNFARSVKGMRGWHFMQKAFEDAESENYYQARTRQMFANIQAGLQSRPAAA